MVKFRSVSASILVAFLAIFSGPSKADTLTLSGVLQDLSGRPIARQSMRVVLGSDPGPRLPSAGRVVVTDMRGRFGITADVALVSRRVRLDSLFTRHASRLLEVGFELDLAGQPALHWVEFDFIAGYGPLRGINTFVAGNRGLFDQPLVFHEREHAWSIPGDPRRMRLTGTGTDVQVESWQDDTPGQWHLDVRVIHQKLIAR